MMSEQIADSFQVSPQQEQLWLAEPDGPAARLQVLVALAGPLDAAALEGALGRVVARHEILRTTFARQPGIRVPLQLVNEELRPAWQTLDLSALGEAEQAAALAELRRSELTEPFDLEHGPLLRAALATCAADRHSLVLTLSALWADASSIAPLLRELVHHHGGAESLVEDPLQYPDFAAWQRELVASEDEPARAAAEFWTRFDEASSPVLPFAKPASSPFVPEEIELQIDGATAAAVEAQAARYGSSLAAFAQAAW